MEIPFEIRLSKSIDAEFIDEVITAVHRAANRIANEVAIRLILNADQALHTTKEKYIRAVSVQGENLASRVVLDESCWIVARIEEGFPKFDQKPGMLAGPKARVSKNGIRYNIIPITKNGVLTFRIVSDNSPATSWIHPGMKARPLMATVIEQYKQEHLIDKILNEELAKVLK